jgi:YD repeat-containing protein
MFKRLGAIALITLASLFASVTLGQSPAHAPRQAREACDTCAADLKPMLGDVKVYLTFDDARRLKSVAVAPANGGSESVYEIEYDSRHNVSAIKGNDGGRATFAHDDRGRLTRMTLPDGKVFTDRKADSADTRAGGAKFRKAGAVYYACEAEGDTFWYRYFYAIAVCSSGIGDCAAAKKSYMQAALVLNFCVANSPK